MQEAKFSATFKLTDKYDSPMFTVRADSIGEFIADLRSLAVESIGTKVAQIDADAKGKGAEAAAVATVTQGFPGSQVVNAPQQSYEPPWQDARPSGASQGPPNVQQLPGAIQRACETCGSPADYREGVNSQGRPYKGFFCTASRDHKPKWVN